uniref:ATP synthase subunit a n=1 Tax=Bryopa lata TaxID=1969317 RepID=A0A1U9XPE5_9BIVA|nr:ATP synthase F0 subunit 6 [Bryopa lata]AQZ26112.1 ATP synthase subunit 6 [Bryopa lata]
MVYDLFSGFDEWNFNLWSFYFMVLLWILSVCWVAGSFYWSEKDNGSVLFMLFCRRFWSTSQVSNMNSSAVRYGGVFHLLISLVVFMVGSNLYGMVPYNFVWMGHFPVILTLAVCFWGACVVHRVLAWGCGVVVGSFVPAGVCWLLIPMVMLGELVSVWLRPLAMCFRMLVNLTVGHLFLSFMSKLVVLVILVGLPFGFLYSSSLSACMVFVAEAGVAILQSYIFWGLVCFYWLEEDPVHWKLKKLVSRLQMIENSKRMSSK